VKDASDAILKPEQAAYLEGIEPARDALLAEMERHAREHRMPISDPEVASFLAVTARAASPKIVVEVGTNIGYGAIVLARAAGPGAKVITIEKSAAHVKTARDYVARAGLEGRIDVREGDAITELEKIPAPIDLLYVDCVKEDYPRYLAIALPKLSDKGVVIADNVLWKGLVAASVIPDGEKARVGALREFNRSLVSDPRLRGVVLPLGDGVGYAVRT
jgi:predicted O-methyltransferase YrrM